MLEKVKRNLGITGKFQDSIIQGWIEEVTQFLIDGGVSEKKITAGLVAIGVKDLWGSEKREYSQYFLQRMIQLAYGDDNDG